MKLFTNKDALDLNKAGFSCFAWEESIKEDGDIEIEVQEDDFTPMPLSFGEGNFQVKEGAKIKVS